MMDFIKQADHIKKKVTYYLRQYELANMSEKTCKAYMRRYIPDKQIDDIFKRRYEQKE
jgi:hypothetical protein